MSRRRTAAPQHKARASDPALQQRLSAGSGRGLSGGQLVLLGVGALVLGGLLVILVVTLLGPGASAVVGQPQANDGEQHLQSGTAGGPYSSIPAASGPHWDQPLNWGVYPSGIPQEPTIHNLEHGGIVIWYQADLLAADEVEELEDYTRSWNASERYKVLVAPWLGPDFGHPVAIVAWTWLLYMDEIDTDLMDRFIDQHYGNAPEPGGGPGPPAQ